jgi:transaldolase
MPEPTLHAVADHGVVRGDTVRRSYAEARQVLDGLAAVGVQYDEVVHALEQDGVTRFQASWTELLDTVEAAIARHKG